MIRRLVEPLPFIVAAGALALAIICLGMPL